MKGSSMVRPKVPASDLRRVQFCRYLEASRDAVRLGPAGRLFEVVPNPEPEESADPGPPPYPFTRGITLVNDGVNYGERVAETVLIGTGQLKQEALTGFRTRTGRYRVSQPLPDSEASKPTASATGKAHQSAE